MSYSVENESLELPPSARTPARACQGTPLLLVTLAAALACTPADEAAVVPSAAAANVLLISVDTLRADHVGAYGYPRDTTPVLDALAEDSVLFLDASAHAPSTLSSHASLLTSQLPAHHGALFNEKRPAPDEALLVSEVVQAAGYSTLAITGGGQLDSAFNLDQGFDQYRVTSGERRFRYTALDYLHWRKNHRERPTFAFLHTYEAHHPYRPKPWMLELFDHGYDGDLPDEIEIDLLRDINQGRRELKEGDLQHIIDAYDAEIFAVDRGLRILLEGLKEEGLYDDTLIIITSDHGEEFDERGWVGWHSHTLYEELLQVPLLIKFPGNEHAGRRIESSVRLLDVAPTILEALGIEAPEAFDGVALQRLLLRDDVTDFPVVAQIDGKENTSVRHGDWKLYDSMLFQLEEDPLEAYDRAAVDGGKVEELARLKEQMFEARPTLHSGSVELDPALQERLKSLGYIDN